MYLLSNRNAVVYSWYREESDDDNHSCAQDHKLAQCIAIYFAAIDLASSGARGFLGEVGRGVDATISNIV